MGIGIECVISDGLFVEFRFREFREEDWHHSADIQKDDKSERVSFGEYFTDFVFDPLFGDMLDEVGVPFDALSGIGSEVE